MQELNIESIVELVKGGSTALALAIGSKPVAVFLDKIAGALGWYLEPKQIVRNAQAEVMANLIKFQGEQEVKSLMARTVTRTLQESEKHQRNMEAIAINTIPNLKEDANPEKVEEDWIDAFFNKCRHVSDEEMQQLWSQVLAGEANQPGKFSLRTLNLLATFTKQDAHLFRKICAYAWIDANTGFTPKMLIFKDMHNKEKYGISRSDVFYCDDIGLIKYEPVAEVKIHSMDYKPIEMIYHNRRFNLVQKSRDGKMNVKVTQLPAGQVKLTQVGKELATICMPEPNWEYLDYVIRKWKDDGFDVIKVSN